MSDQADYSHVLYHDDLSGFTAGPVPGTQFKIVERGLGKYLEPESPHSSYLYAVGGDECRDCRFRAVVTPVSFVDAPPVGGFCGIVARFRNSNDYLALVLSRDEQLKLLRRTPEGFDLLASCALEFCIGQSLTLTLTVAGEKIIGTAGPYAGATTVEARLPSGAMPAGGKAGFVGATQARFGPHTLECTPDEARRIGTVTSAARYALIAKRSNFPAMKRERVVPLNGLATADNLFLADLDGDGALEVLVAQSSQAIADRLSLTDLTCLTAMKLSGEILWQAGIPDPRGEKLWPVVTPGILPFRIHDLYGDGHLVVVCVFGFDIQVRDGKTGRILMSAQTPSTVPVSEDFKNVMNPGTKGWGDETLNMRVRRIEFCDTEGNGGKKEILITDNRQNLAVLDPLAEPVLHPILRHRGKVGGEPWIGDCDGDGRDEMFFSTVLIDHDGKAVGVADVNGISHTALVIDPLGGQDLRYFGCVSDDDGLGAVSSSRWWKRDAGRAAQWQARLAGSDLIAGKFRGDVPGLQFVTTRLCEHMDGRLVSLFDSELNRIWSREFDVFSGGLAAVNWDGKQNLLLFTMDARFGLLDGNGDVVVQIPADAEYSYCKPIQGYCADGRDAIAAWQLDELAIYVPEGASAKV